MAFIADNDFVVTSNEINQSVGTRRFNDDEKKGQTFGNRSFSEHRIVSMQEIYIMCNCNGAPVGIVPRTPINQNKKLP